MALSADAAAGLGRRGGRAGAVSVSATERVHEPAVVAVYEKSLGFADVLLPWAAVEDAPDRPAALPGPGGGRRRPGPDRRRRWRSSSVEHPTAVVGGPEIIAAAEDANADTQAWVNYMLLGLVIAFAAFAVVNTLMLAIRDRGREYALLQLVGASRLQVRRMMRIEALVLVLLGWGIGIAVAATTLMPFSAVRDRLGRGPTSRWVIWAPSCWARRLLAWLATMLPTRGTMRARPVDAIGIRE